jgi:hypothetical protein
MELSRPIIRFPSFVQCAPAGLDEEAELVSHWSPARTGVETVDVARGLHYFSEALNFVRQMSATDNKTCVYFLVCVLKEMRFSPIGTIERAFLGELASKAMSGGSCPELAHKEAEMLAHLSGVDLPLVREVEGAIRDYILWANYERRPGNIHVLLNDWMRAPDGWVSELAALGICGAAIKGVAN